MARSKNIKFWPKGICYKLLCVIYALFIYLFLNWVKRNLFTLRFYCLYGMAYVFLLIFIDTGSFLPLLSQNLSLSQIGLLSFDFYIGSYHRSDIIPRPFIELKFGRLDQGCNYVGGNIVKANVIKQQ